MNQRDGCRQGAELRNGKHYDRHGKVFMACESHKYTQGEVNMENVETRIKQVIAEHLGLSIADIRNDAHVVNDLGADSLDTIEMVMALEDEFGIEIPDETAERWGTVQEVITGINTYNLDLGI